MSQGKERQILWVRAWLRPGHGIRKLQAFLDQEFQPKRRESVTSELSTPEDLPILLNDPWTGYCLCLPFKYPIHHEARRGAPRLDACGHEDVGIQDDESHLALRRCRTTRTWSISLSISRSLRLIPGAFARRQVWRRLAFAMARRSSRSSTMTSPSTGIKKYAGPPWPDNNTVSPTGTAFKAFEPRVRNSRNDT